jgi:hypothetical protein
MVDGLREGFLVGSTTRVRGKEVFKNRNDKGTNRVCGQSVGRIEGSRGVKKWRSEVCVG